MDNRDDILFIIGANRSGTSLLATILGSHEEINPTYKLPKDNKPPINVKNNTTRAYSESGIWGDRLNVPNRGSQWGLSRNMEKNIVEDVDDELKKKLIAELNKETVEGKVTLIKVPINILRLRLIKRLYPNVKIVFIIRNVENYVFGCKNKWNINEKLIREHWFNLNQYGLSILKEYYTPDSYKILFFEDLLDKDKAKETLFDLCDFIGIDKTKKMNINFIKNKYSHIKTYERQDLGIFENKKINILGSGGLGDSVLVYSRIKKLDASNIKLTHVMVKQALVHSVKRFYASQGIDADVFKIDNSGWIKSNRGDFDFYFKTNNAQNWDEYVPFPEYVVDDSEEYDIVISPTAGRDNDRRFTLDEIRFFCKRHKDKKIVLIGKTDDVYGNVKATNLINKTTIKESLSIIKNAKFVLAPAGFVSIVAASMNKRVYTKEHPQKQRIRDAYYHPEWKNNIFIYSLNEIDL